MFKCMDMFGMCKEILPVYFDGLTNSFCVFGMCKEILPVYFDELAISFFLCVLYVKFRYLIWLLGFFIMFRWIVNFYLEIRI